jgi:predicted transposase/invertase (TIGR01784 family)
MANEYDRIMKENFREPSVALLNVLFKLEVVETQPLVTKIQYTIAEREADLLLKATTASGALFIIHVEWQSTNDPSMCSRMLLYHALIYELYKIEVRGFVVYTGSKKMNMPNSLLHGRLSYSFDLVNPRLFDPEVFLSSELPEEVILAILAGSSKTGRREIIRKILHKLQLLLKDNQLELDKKVAQLEMISMLRGEQKTVTEEEKHMALSSIDFTKDIRYQQGVGYGMEKGIEKGTLMGREEGKELAKEENAINLIKEGLDLNFIQRTIGLPRKKINELAAQVAATNKHKK